MEAIPRYYHRAIAIVRTGSRESISSPKLPWDLYTAEAMMIGQLALEKQGLTLHPTSAPQGEGREMRPRMGTLPLDSIMDVVGPVVQVAGPSNLSHIQSDGSHQTVAGPGWCWYPFG